MKTKIQTGNFKKYRLDGLNCKIEIINNKISDKRTFIGKCSNASIVNGVFFATEPSEGRNKFILEEIYFASTTLPKNRHMYSIAKG